MHVDGYIYSKMQLICSRVSNINILFAVTLYLIILSVKVINGAKIRNRYNQVPHLTQDTNGKKAQNREAGYDPKSLLLRGDMRLSIHVCVHVHRYITGSCIDIAILVNNLNTFKILALRGIYYLVHINLKRLIKLKSK